MATQSFDPNMAPPTTPPPSTGSSEDNTMIATRDDISQGLGIEQPWNTSPMPKYVPREEYFKVDPTKRLAGYWRTGADSAQGRGAAQWNDLYGQTDTGNMAEMRKRQLGYLAGLQAQAAGTAGPSQAEMMVRQERDKGIQQAMAMAASGKGVSPGAALRQAQEQAGSTGIAAAQQGTMLKAQEQAAAQQMYGQAMAGMREQDFGQAQLQQQANMAELQANMQSELAQRQMNDQMTQYYLNMGMSLEQATLQANIAIEQMRADQQIAANQGLLAKSEGSANRTASMVGGGVTAVGMLGAGALMASDRNAKTNIKKGDSKIGEFMDALQSYEYDYKDEKYGAGKQHGVMVQDLEKSEAGRSITGKIDNYKAIDTVKALGPVLSSIAELNKRQKAITKILGGK